MRPKPMFIVPIAALCLTLLAPATVGQEPFPTPRGQLGGPERLDPTISAPSAPLPTAQPTEPPPTATPPPRPATPCPAATPVLEAASPVPAASPEPTNAAATLAPDSSAQAAVCETRQ